MELLVILLLAIFVAVVLVFVISLLRPEPKQDLLQQYIHDFVKYEFDRRGFSLPPQQWFGPAGTPGSAGSDVAGTPGYAIGIDAPIAKKRHLKLVVNNDRITTSGIFP